MKPKGKVEIKWSPDFSYAVGLLVADGSLSIDGRHINFTSKDEEQIENIQKALKISCNVRMKGRGKENTKRYYYIDIGDVIFYRFLQDIGLMPNKTKQIGAVDIPDIYFFDFLRGHFDGDGYFYSYYDKRWKSSFMFYTIFLSASRKHIEWIHNEIQRLTGFDGHVQKGYKRTAHSVRFAKEGSLLLLPKMYHSKGCIHLTRK